MRIERVEPYVPDPEAFVQAGASSRPGQASDKAGPNLGQVVDQFFKSADADGDGNVTQPELEQALQKVLSPPVVYTRSGDVQTEPQIGGFSGTA